MDHGGLPAACVICCGAGLLGVAGGAVGVRAGAWLVGVVRSLLVTELELARRDAKIESVIEVSMKMTAHQVVNLLSRVAAPRGPNAAWLPAPPKVAARSALLPLCSRTTPIRNRQTIT